MEKFEYSTPELKEAEKEMIRASMIKDLEGYRNCEQRKALKNHLIKSQK